MSHEAPVPQGVERIRAPNPSPLTLSGTNTYLVGAPAYVIDPGPADEAHLDRVLAAAERHGGVAGIALTHRHLDHAGGVAYLRERTGAPLAAGAQPPREPGVFEEPGARDIEPDVLLRDGGHFGPLEAIETPGHSPDHVTLLAGTVAFCGDTILGEGSVFIAPGGGSLAAYLASLNTLAARSLTALCPGHGPVVDDPSAKIHEYIEHRLERERRLIAALERGLRGRDEILDEVWDDVPSELRLAAALTLEAHLEKLEGEDRLPEGVERLSL